MKVIITDYQYEDIEVEKSLIEQAGHELLTYQIKDARELLPYVKDADAIIAQYADINAELIAALTQCKMIIRYGIGVNNIDIDAASKKGIYVCNVPDYCIDEVSDHACAMLLSLGRKLPILSKSFSEGDWGYSSIIPLTRLSHCTLGLVGFGRIPQMVAQKMKAFGLKILVYDPYLTVNHVKSFPIELVSLSRLVSESDFISVHVPLNEETQHLISEREFSLMKSTTVIINTARGGIIDEKALIANLLNKKIAAAGLDVFEDEPLDLDSPLLHLPNVIATPHCAWYSETAIKDLQRSVAEEVVNVLGGNLPFNAVNKII